MFYDPFKSQARLNSKRAREIHERVQNRLGRFGDSVVNLVADLALTPRKIQTILERLNVSPHSELDAQLDTLAYYVAQSGANEFVARVQAELAAANQETTRVDRPSRDPSFSAEPAHRISTGKYLRAPAFEKTAKKEAPIPEPPPALDDVLPGVIEETAPAPPDLGQQYPDVDPSTVVIRELAWIETTGYTGPERRSGPADRRSHQERRGTLGAVMINRRYGGDRRHQSRGRRHTDHEKKK